MDTSPGAVVRLGGRAHATGLAWTAAAVATWGTALFLTSPFSLVTIVGLLALSTALAATGIRRSRAFLQLGEGSRTGAWLALPVATIIFMWDLYGLLVYAAFGLLGGAD
jgi:hypothetical protein